MRIPMVEVVPMSRPRTQGIGCRLAGFVIPANAGIQTRVGARLRWIPAFAGMTRRV
jgi:hypothetical protein